MVSRKRVRRSNWTKMVTTKIIIEKMDNMTATATVEETELAEAPEVAAIRPRAIDEQRLDIRHCKTNEMIADGFT